MEATAARTVWHAAGGGCLQVQVLVTKGPLVKATGRSAGGRDRDGGLSLDPGAGRSSLE